VRRAQDVVKSVDLLPRKHVTRHSHAGRNEAVERQFIHLARKVDMYAMMTISILQQLLLASIYFVLSKKHSSQSDCKKLTCRVNCGVVRCSQLHSHHAHFNNPRRLTSENVVLGPQGRVQLKLAWPVSRRDDIRGHGSQHTSGSVTDDRA
jgi:hypothetical protein